MNTIDISLQKRRTRMLARALLWFTVLLVVVGSIGYYYYFLRLPSAGVGPAGPRVDQTLFSSIWDDRPTVFLGIGDSVTAGFGASPGKSYFDRLVANPSDEFIEMKDVCLKTVFPRLQVANASVSGSNSFDCLEKQLPELKPHPTDVRGLVVLTTGGNDLIHWYGRSAPKEGAMYGATLDQAQPWIEAYALRMNEIIAKIETIFPGGCEIFLANIYDPSDGAGKPEAIGMPPWEEMVEILAAYNNVITSCAGGHDNVHLVDIHTPFLGHGVRAAHPWANHYHSADPHYWYNENIEDPNDRGYDALRRIFLRSMADVFADRE
jgi:lysophospholipase L1-like esterase